jgi:hypothetical protein
LEAYVLENYKGSSINVAIIIHKSHAAW